MVAQPISFHLRIKVRVTNESGKQLLWKSHRTKGKNTTLPPAVNAGGGRWKKIGVTAAAWSEVVVHIRGETWKQHKGCSTFERPEFREHGFKKCFSVFPRMRFADTQRPLYKKTLSSSPSSCNVTLQIDPVQYEYVG